MVRTSTLSRGLTSCSRQRWGRNAEHLGDPENKAKKEKWVYKIKNGSLYQLGLLMFQIENLNRLKQWENLWTYITEQSRGSAGFKAGLISSAMLLKALSPSSAFCSWCQFYPESDFTHGCKMAPTAPGMAFFLLYVQRERLTIFL